MEPQKCKNVVQDTDFSAQRGSCQYKNKLLLNCSIILWTENKIQVGKNHILLSINGGANFPSSVSCVVTADSRLVCLSVCKVSATGLFTVQNTAADFLQGLLTHHGDSLSFCTSVLHVALSVL